eukprot:jgi/Galph1/1044/GphlegSOOS_G5811.1
MAQDSDNERESLMDKSSFSNGTEFSRVNEEFSTASGYTGYAGFSSQSVRRRTSSIDNHGSPETISSLQAQYGYKGPLGSSSPSWKSRQQTSFSDREPSGSVTINLRPRTSSLVISTTQRNVWRSLFLVLRWLVSRLLSFQSFITITFLSFSAVMLRLYSMPQVRRGTFLTFRGEKILPFLATVPLFIFALWTWSSGWWSLLRNSESPESENSLSRNHSVSHMRRRRAPVTLQLAPIFGAVFLFIIFILLKEHNRLKEYRDAAGNYYRYLHEESPAGSRSLSLGGIPIRAMTYNVFSRPPGISGRGGDDHKDERLMLLTPRLANYDVVCFQELFDAFSTRRSALMEAVATFGLRFFNFSPQKIFHIIDGGVSIVSRYPIVESDYIHYKNIVATTIDSIVGKGVLYARIELPSSLSSDRHVVWNSTSFPAGVNPAPIEKARFLHVFSTHMQAGDRLGYKPEKYHAGIRLKQAEEMRDFILRKTKDDFGPVLITGDFNINARISRENASDSKWYKGLMSVLKSTSDSSKDMEPLQLYDLLHLSYGEHPITDDSKCIDYFLFDPRQGRVIASYVDDDAVHIEPFLIAPEEQDPDHSIGAPSLSDHSALISTLRVILHSPSLEEK